MQLAHAGRSQARMMHTTTSSRQAVPAAAAVHRRRPATTTRLPLRRRAVVSETFATDNGAAGQQQDNGGAGGQQQHFVPDSLLQAAPDAPHKQQFNWFKQWYPVAVAEDLSTELPTHQQLLGLDLAIWWDANAQQWRAFQDRCPHRLAPLSEGIIDATSGHLFCSYHGWTFDGSGRCTGIPQLPEGQAISAARSCVASYPTCVREGLLWVWPDAGAAALVESVAEDAWPGVAPELDRFGDRGFSRSAARHKWYARDMPYPWLAAKENAYNDCSHDTVLHHGVSSFANRARAAPIPMRVGEMGPRGYTVRETTGAFEDVTRFPCGARRQRGGFAGVAYVVPTAVGRCKQFHAFLQTDPDAPPAPGASPLARLRGWLAGSKPTWMQHMFSHVLIDADIAIQARVDVNRAADDHVYMPAAADAGPAAFMRWLKEFGGGGPPVCKLKDPFVGAVPAVPVQDRRQLLDRFSQHTAHCKACRRAHARAAVAHKLAGVVAVVAASAALAAGLLLATGSVVGAAGGTGGVVVVALLAGVAAAAAVAWAALGQLVQKFLFVDYDSQHVGKRPAH